MNLSGDMEFSRILGAKTKKPMKALKDIKAGEGTTKSLTLEGRLVGGIDVIRRTKTRTTKTARVTWIRMCLMACLNSSCIDHAHPRAYSFGVALRCLDEADQ